MRQTSRIWAFSLAFLASVGWAAERPSAPQERPDLTRINLEELMDIEVISVAKKPEKRMEAAAAIYVITQEDIRRSGVTSIPEALRLAPGVQVARIDANKWAVGIRSFSNLLSRSLLVLIDGRSVYSPLLAGVFWDVQDTLLEDIDRIEVIRGPGGAIWGANAVNGVINIITKRAQETQGGLLIAGGGSEEQGFGGIRYGSKIGERFAYRVYGKILKRDAGFHRDTPDFDDWRMGQVGFRTDWEGRRGDTLTFQGDLYAGEAGQRALLTTLTPPLGETVEADIDLAGGNLLGRWQHAFDVTSVMTLQLYYDHTHRRELIFREDRNTFDLDFHYRFRLPWRQDLTLGLGYRLTSGDAEGIGSVEIVPSRRTDQIFSAFVQDEIGLIAERLHLIVGSKFEHNDYSGFEFQPNARLLWTPTPRHSIWAAVSGATRTPSRVEHDITQTVLVDPETLTFIRVNGDEEFDTEELLAYELGYRLQPTSWLFLDVAAFYNRYTDLLSLEADAPLVETTPPPPRVILPFFLRNKLHGEVYGVELAADWQPFTWWRVSSTYAYLQIDLRQDADSMDLSTARTIEGASPHHQVSLRSFMNLPGHLELDLVWRYVGDLPSLDVDSYLSLDLRLAWRPLSTLSVEVVGQNLLEAHHLEFVGGGSGNTEVERGIYGKIVWRW
jgi:iron complex outermembrane receptor protein